MTARNARELQMDTRDKGQMCSTHRLILKKELRDSRSDDSNRATKIICSTIEWRSARGS